MADSWRGPLRRNRKLADMTKHVPPVCEWNQGREDDMTNLKDILTLNKIKSLAGARSFERGMDYAESGAVVSINSKENEISGKVEGQHTYRVRLFADKKGEIDWECSCPVGMDGDFCKHCVALGLQWLENKDEIKSVEKERNSISDAKRIADFLDSLDKTELVKIIKTQADKDDSFYRNLLMSSLSSVKKKDSSAVKNVIREAFRTGGFIDYKEAWDFTDSLMEVCDMLKKMITTPESAENVMELTEYAMKRWEAAIEGIDDSDGGMGSVLDELHEIHFEACKVAKPEGIKLAEKLFNITVSSGWDMFLSAYDAYSEVFEEKGRDAYRKLVKEKWNKNKSDKNFHKNYWLKDLMTKFAVEEHNFDAEMEILSSDLSYSNAYCKIAERCIEEKKPELALEWLKKGLTKFKDDSRLLVKLYELYWKMKRQDDAINTIWNLFSSSLNLEHYQTLAKYSKLVDSWDKWRNKATDKVRSSIALNREKYKGNKYTWFRVDNSLMVEIFLWEKDIEQAWEEFQDGGCSEGLSVRLCEARQENHPEDVVDVYLKIAERKVNLTNNDAYREAVKLIKFANTQAARGNKVQIFNTKILEMKKNFKAKRNFMRGLENAGF